MRYSKDEILTAAKQEVEAWKSEDEPKRTDWDYEKLGFVQSVVARMETNSKNKVTPLLAVRCPLVEIAAECRKYVKCDTARISKPLDKMFLIIGFNRNTKDDEGVWVNQENQRIDFDYVQESVVANGKTKKELIESAKEYQRICGITWEQYFQELAQKICR